MVTGYVKTCVYGREQMLCHSILSLSQRPTQRRVLAHDIR